MKLLGNLNRLLYEPVRFFSRQSQKPEFGIIFDIDGVIARGSKVLPAAKAAFSRLVDSDQKLRLPVVFVTNAGNCLRSDKADYLSKWLELPIQEDQVVMSHSPLKLMREYHDKQVLLCGQGPIGQIAHNLGFRKFTSIDEVRLAFPLLDTVDLERRNVKHSHVERSLQPIEAIVLLGEPVRWETSLQLLIDTLMTNGFAEMPPSSVNYPHIPLLACNMDLQWMSEASMPRFGHGAFLLCLEALYQKITSFPLIYTALIGKPSEITYHHSFQMLLLQASSLGSYPRRLYAVGDNIFTDIYGANLYDKYLGEKKKAGYKYNSSSTQLLERVISHSSSEPERLADSCCSILVETGVYSRNKKQEEQSNLDHYPRDFQPTAEDLKAKHILKDVAEAVDVIFQTENFY